MTLFASSKASLDYKWRMHLSTILYYLTLLLWWRILKCFLMSDEFRLLQCLGNVVPSVLLTSVSCSLQEVALFFVSMMSAQIDDWWMPALIYTFCSCSVNYVESVHRLSHRVLVYIDVDVSSYCCQIGCSSTVDVCLLKAMYRVTSIGLFSHVHVVWHLPHLIFHQDAFASLIRIICDTCCVLCSCLSEVISCVIRKSLTVVTVRTWMWWTEQKHLFV